jgi:hypothetical protein
MAPARTVTELFHSGFRYELYLQSGTLGTGKTRRVTHMMLMLATLSLFATAQTMDARPDTGAAVTPADSTRAEVVDAARITPGAPRRSSAQVGVGAATFFVDEDTDVSDSVPAQRRRAVEHSAWYYRRLTIHKVASFATIPLFVTEYVLGDKLFKGTASSSTKSAHGAVAGGIGVLFGVNSLTGGWNLWDSRHESAGRARRMTHGLLMLASDAGFLATAALAPEEFGDDGGSNRRSTHRAVAISSMGVAAASYLMMYLWK